MVDLLELIGHFLNRLEIYTEFPPAEATYMDEIVVNILVKLLYTLALTTKMINKSRLSESIVGEGTYYLTYE